MGGKLFKGISIPMDKIKHDTIKKEILEIISNNLQKNIYKIEEVKFIKNKTSFNDIDFIFDYDRNKFGIANPIRIILFSESESGNFSNIFQNGPIISCLYKKQYHIDFMIVENNANIPFKNYSSMQYYYDYELGNFLGKIAKRFNCTLKPTGLYFTPRNLITGEKFNSAKDIFLTNNIENISNFLGYNISKYFQGFENENEFFEYLGSSLNFKAEYYVSDELSKSTSRLRDKKRPKYQRFLEYYNIDYARDRMNKDSTSFKLPYKECIQRCKDFNLIESTELILNKLNEYNLHKELLKLNSLKFNGDICSTVTGLQKEKLGEFIVSYKECINAKIEFFLFVQNNDSLTIKNSILNFYEKGYKIK
jgi:hypothetical protein